MLYSCTCIISFFQFLGYTSTLPLLYDIQKCTLLVKIFLLHTMKFKYIDGLFLAVIMIEYIPGIDLIINKKLKDFKTRMFLINKRSV